MRVAIFCLILHQKTVIKSIPVLFVDICGFSSQPICLDFLGKGLVSTGALTLFLAASFLFPNSRNCVPYWHEYFGIVRKRGIDVHGWKESLVVYCHQQIPLEKGEDKLRKDQAR